MLNFNSDCETETNESLLLIIIMRGEGGGGGEEEEKKEEEGEDDDDDDISLGYRNRKRYDYKIDGQSR